VTTVEIDEDVIAMSDLFGVPASDKRNRVVHADAADYFAATDDCADVVLIDGCDRLGTASVFCEPGFYETLRRKLHPNGILVINLVGNNHRRSVIQRCIFAAFSDRVGVLDISRDDNRLLFAFNNPDIAIDWPEVRRRAEKLALVHEIDFPAIARRLQRGCRFGKRK
jgi:spermidine synthase